jgi:hypothetical protein
VRVGGVDVEEEEGVEDGEGVVRWEESFWEETIERALAVVRRGKSSSV